MEKFIYRRQVGIKSPPVMLNWEIFDKIYLSKRQICEWLKRSIPYINRLLEEKEILEFEIRWKKVFIVKTDFIKFLAKD
jgi:hypothetical protein